MLRLDAAVMVLIDVQGKLADAMFERDALLDSLRRLIQGVRTLGVPLLWTEQNPARMGPTVAPLRDLLQGLAPLGKMAFSCCGEASFVTALEATGRRQVLLAGIETHVCVWQTAADLRAVGYAVEVPADAVSSRTAASRLIGLERIRSAGAGVTSVETALFELMGTAEHPAFRDILKIVK
jgi:nicotinamidase-related amidase